VAENVAENATNRRINPIKTGGKEDKRAEMTCDHPISERVWDYERGEEICRRCGEVISTEPVLVPKIKHDEKLQSYLSRTKLNIGTLPPEGRERTEITASNIAAKICFDLAFPKFIKDQHANSRGIHMS